MLVRFVHERKAFSPIEVTLSGIVMLVRLVQPENAIFPIEVTAFPPIVLGIATDV